MDEMPFTLGEKITLYALIVIFMPVGMVFWIAEKCGWKPEAAVGQSKRYSDR